MTYEYPLLGIEGDIIQAIEDIDYEYPLLEIEEVAEIIESIKKE